MREERQLSDLENEIIRLKADNANLKKERDDWKKEAGRGVRLNDVYTHGLSRESDLL